MPDIDPPQQKSFVQSALVLIREFETKKQCFIDSHGNWQQNPENLPDRGLNELLFQIWRLEEAARKNFFENASKFFCNRARWSTAKSLTFALLEEGAEEACTPKKNDADLKILDAYSQNRPKKFLPLLIALNSISMILYLRTLRLLKDTKAAEWDKEALALKQNAQLKRNELFLSISRFTEEKELADFESELEQSFFETNNTLFTSILDFLSNEERFRNIFAGLLEMAKDERKREEVFLWIQERMIPFQGIVSNTPPALLRPCLNFLRDPKIELTSGIPYQSSVILSILQDPRSTPGLFEALNRFPVFCSKIRENIIYTLGNLREKDAVRPLAEVLNLPDKLKVASPKGEKILVHLFEQKAEAIWALGKIGLPSLDALQDLLKITDHPSAKLKTYLAWALGEIGKAQKAARGGVSTEIVIALLRLLKTRNKRLFEETVAALRKIGLPEFIHTLYLYNVGSVNLLGLAPAQKGLYELSETIHYLIEKKGQAVVAVNGDSGTGKTYFCQSLVNGFGNVEAKEILHLMRDRKKDQHILNRILGLKWLKSHVDPIHYQDDFLPEDEDAPEKEFQEFIQNQQNKKLILLDGCRDEAYFQRIIDLFYFRGRLDIGVNFRATHSTRRLNLEQREIAIESVKTHLAFFQEPPLEETLLYQEGNTLLYDLDNSIASRLDSTEILELFQKKRIERWDDLILLGHFNKEMHALPTSQKQLVLRHNQFLAESETWKEKNIQSFQPEERKFFPQLNTDPAKQPNLITIFSVSDIKPRRLRFYAQDQIVGIGEEGSVFIITFLDNRIFFSFQEHIKSMSLLGRDILLLNEKGEALILSFERNELLRLEETGSPVSSLATLPEKKAITGHMDGSILIWDLANKRLQKIDAHSGPVLSLCTDYWGRIYSIGQDFFLKNWDPNEGTVSAAAFPNERIFHLSPHPGEKILALSDIPAFHLLDFKRGKKTSIFSPASNPFSRCYPLKDGRLISICTKIEIKSGTKTGFLALVSPSQNDYYLQILDSHPKNTYDCLVMGPKIITCGRESKSEYSFRIWGTEYQARTAIGKMEILAG
jgi:hypothetical protein